MKAKFTLVLVALLAIAEMQAQKNFRHIMTLNMDQTMQKAYGNTKVLNGNLYAVGAFTGSAAQIPNGQTMALHNILFWQNSDISTSPLSVGDGVPSPTGKGMYDITALSNQLWMVGEGMGPELLYTFDDASDTWIAKDVTAGDGKNFTLVESIDNSTLLLIGNTSLCNNVSGNKAYLFDVTTEQITAVSGSGLGDQYNRPVNITRDGNKLYIIGTSGVHVFDTQTKTLTAVAIAGVYPVIDFLAHGDTSYVIGPTNFGATGGGDGLWQKIGNGNWDLKCLAPIMHTASLQYFNGNVHIVGSYNEIIGADSSVYAGSDLAFSEKTQSVIAMEINTIPGMQRYLKLPNSDDYFGWSDGNLFTTATLVSGVKNITNDTQLHLYPNPTTNFVTISGIKPGQDILIRDIAGKTLLHQTAISENFVFNTQDLNAGLYFVNKQKLLVVH